MALHGSLPAHAHSFPEWGNGLRAPPPSQIDEQNSKGTMTCKCTGILVPDRLEVIRLIRPNTGRASIQTSIPIPDPDPEHRVGGRPRSCLMGIHTCRGRSSLRPPRQLPPLAPYGDRPSYVPDPDKPGAVVLLDTDVPPKRLRLLTAFHHLNQSGQWHKLCHCASQTDELCSTTLIQPITSPDWEREQNFFLDLNSRETWADGEAQAHFESARWGRLLDLNSQTWADCAAFSDFESALPGLSKDSPFLPDWNDNFENHSASVLPPPADRALPSSTGPTYLSGPEKESAGDGPRNPGSRRDPPRL